MSDHSRATLSRWEDIERERLNPLLDRRMVTGERIMLTQIFLKKGCIVPLHSHENEQMSYVVEGDLLFRIGSEEGEQIRVQGGEVLLLPSNVPHKVEALQDSLSMDVFSPPREDWLSKTDDYLRET